jgi:hypothetical protein
VGEYASLRFDYLHRPFITYYDSLNARLKLTYFDFADASWHYTFVPNVGEEIPGDAPMSADESLVSPEPPQPADSFDPELIALMEQAAGQADVQPDAEAVTITPPTQQLNAIPSVEEPVVDESQPLPEDDNPDKPSLTERLNQALEAATDAIQTLAPNFPFESFGYGKHSSIFIDRRNHVHITYHDEIDGSLEYVRWEGGDRWFGKIVDDPGDQGDEGLWTSLEVDYNFNVHVAYMSEKYDDLKYAKRNAEGGWNITTLDGNRPGNGTDVGSFASIAIDGEFRPHITYYDFTQDSIRHAWKTDGEWKGEVIENTGMTGWYTSIAIDPGSNTKTNDNILHVSYYNVTRGDLKYARKSDGGGWAIQTLDQTGAANIGLFTSISLDGDARPAISYLHASNGTMRYIRRNRNTGWSNPQIVNSNVSRDVGLATSLAISTSGVPFVSYLDATSGLLKMARTYGSFWQITPLVSSPPSGLYSSIDVLGESPRIAYYEQLNRNLMYAQYVGGSLWTGGRLDGYGDVGRYVSMEVDNTGVPHMAYYDNSRKDLLYASWNPQVSASGWYTQPVDYINEVGWYTSIAVNDTNEPFISYYDQTTGSLRMAYRSRDVQAWITWVVDNIGLHEEGGVGAYSSIDIDDQGKPHISYYDIENKTLKYAYWGGAWTGVPSPPAWIISTVDPALADVGRFSSLVVNDNDGTSHICYYDLTNGDLKYAQGNYHGIPFQIQVVDGSLADGDGVNEGDVGAYCSIDLNSAGLPGISYYDNSHADLKVALAFAPPAAGSVYLPLAFP